MANTRYQPVPVQDSYRDEEAAYTQTPPSYQQEQEPVPGEARTEDDNVPDDFKFGGSVAEATLPVRMMVSSLEHNAYVKQDKLT